MGGGCSHNSLFKSDYIFFLDSDDLLTNTALENLVKIATQNKPSLVIGSVKIFGEYNKNIIHDEGFKNKDSILDKKTYFSFGWGGLIAIDFFKDNLRFIDSKFMVNDDNFFGLDLFIRAKTIYYSSHICVWYRVNYGSISHPKSYCLNGDINLYYTYYLNAYNIKMLAKNNKKYKKILNYNARYNANAFIAMSNKLNLYEREKIKNIKNIVSIKYKIFIISPYIFNKLKYIWKNIIGLLKELVL